MEDSGLAICLDLVKFTCLSS